MALARALVLEPDVLLLDEPFASLDHADARTALIADLGAVLRQDRVTTVLVTHDRGEAQALADRVAVLIGGRIQQVDDDGRASSRRRPPRRSRASSGVETIVSGRVVERDGGVTRVEVGGRTLEVAATRRAREPGARRHPPGGRDAGAGRASVGRRLQRAQRCWPGSIARITVTDTGGRVVVDCGFPLVATVTPRSVERAAAWWRAWPIVAMFKASAPHLIPSGPRA